MQNQGSVQFGDIVMTILSNSNDLTVSEMSVPAGTVAALHHHPHEEVNYVVSGTLECMCDGNKETLVSGDYIKIPPNVEHNITNSSNSDAKVLSIWTPSRQDLMNKIIKS